jgi:phage shock protein A
VTGLKQTADEKIEQLESDLKQLKKELQEEREARTALEKRFSDLEEVIRKRDSKASGKRV